MKRTANDAATLRARAVRVRREALAPAPPRLELIRSTPRAPEAAKP